MIKINNKKLIKIPNLYYKGSVQCVVYSTYDPVGCAHRVQWYKPIWIEAYQWNADFR